LNGIDYPSSMVREQEDGKVGGAGDDDVFALRGKVSMEHPSKDTLSIQLFLPVPFRMAAVLVDILLLDHHAAAFLLSIPPSLLKSQVAEGKKMIEISESLPSPVPPIQKPGCQRAGAVQAPI
jgi:hypothetical protein